MEILALCYVIAGAFVIQSLLAKRQFDKRRDAIRYRIHVNGIRGKSTVTRYITAILRDSGVNTFGKTTGTAARVIMPDGTDAVIQRRGYPNVTEQLAMIRSFSKRRAQAVVVECMAIKPDYQDWLENKVMHSHITVITNVRVDHQEEMGNSLQEIARSLSRSIPKKSVLITAERRKDILEILREECLKRQTRLIQAPIHLVKDSQLTKFGHMAHKENVAIGLAVAKMFSVPLPQAMQSMVNAPADPGAFQVQTIKQDGKIVQWANLFAVNDKESFASIAEDLVQKYPNHHKIALLNNRHDRPSRVEMFSKLAQSSLGADAIVALGDYEERVKRAIYEPNTRVALLGNSSKFAMSTGKELMKKIIGLSTQKQVLLVGTVNIHSRQSEQLLEYIAETTNTHTSDDRLPVFEPRRMLANKLKAIPARLLPSKRSLADDNMAA
jgi:poly-gamma-glutamate synthase PgsB/CapB